MRKKQLTIVPMLLSAGLLLAQAPDQSSMGQQSQNGSQALPSTGQAQPVQESVPFGSVNGRLVTSGNNLIFIDDQQPQNSFVINRSDIRDVKYEGSMATLSLKRPVRDSAGERSTLNFRFQNPAAATMITSWVGPGATTAHAAALQPAPATSGVQAASVDGAARTQRQQATAPPLRTESFDVRRNRALWRSDTGRLFLTPTEVIYQSVSNPGASRRWAMSAIREVERKNPFDLKVKAYSGGDYEFKILGGSGLATAQYMALVDRVNLAHLRTNQVPGATSAVAGAPVSGQ
jgi:hypothetical protein